MFVDYGDLILIDLSHFAEGTGGIIGQGKFPGSDTATSGIIMKLF